VAEGYGLTLFCCLLYSKKEGKVKQGYINKASSPTRPKGGPACLPRVHSLRYKNREQFGQWLYSQRLLRRWRARSKLVTPDSTAAMVLTEKKRSPVSQEEEEW
jgi:hypothetical protein